MASIINQQLQEVKSSNNKEQIQQVLIKSLAEALFLNPMEIPIAKPFIDLGMDSIVGVEWVKALNKEFGLEISSTKIYDYSTVKELAKFIAIELEKENTSSNVELASTTVSPIAQVNNLQEVDAIKASQNIPSKEAGAVYTKGQLHQKIKTSLGEALFLNPSEINIDKSFIDLGMDSIVGVEWVKIINKEFGLDVSSTRLYDYSTIKDFATFLAKELESQPVSTINELSSNSSIKLASDLIRSTPLLGSFPNLKRRSRTKKVVQSSDVVADDKIAIIGMSGRYPQASNMQQYWNNLYQGKNCITEIPLSRWDVKKYYDPDPTKIGKMYCKWLGMLDEVDCFDPLFFQITPAEAEFMDPQHRIFLQESYRAFEDAGYSTASLSNTRCGVYMGIMSSDYSHHLSKLKSDSVNITGNSFAIGAGRIAYSLNLKGPAIPIDTACSSSLVSIHIASKALLNNEIDMALAGGVSLYLLPESYVGMCEAGMLSPQGQCKTFDDSANGFVPGEGVGTVVLKRLKDAERDNDFIYGVILGSGINQDGKTNGITAPSVNSQIELEREVYARHNIDPETISYVETHGTGTKLGDPIELEALETVFKEKTSKKNFCALGSVKSNIGHTSGAAGVASVQKVLLSMQHQTLVPTLNVTKENSIFDFKNSPFYISKEKHEWKTDQKGSLRRAAVSSFGYSGTNAHLVIEEYPQKIKKKQLGVVINQHSEVLIILSARTDQQLNQRCLDLLAFVRDNQESIDLTDLAYTLQLGKDEMKERLGFIVSSVEQLKEKLEAWTLGTKNLKNTFRGQVMRDKENLSIGESDADLKNKVDKLISDKDWTKILELWVQGLDTDWNKLYVDNKPYRISLPTYPFAKERCWVDLPTEVTANFQRETNETQVHTELEIQEEIQRIHFHPKWEEDIISTKSVTDDNKLLSGPTLIFDSTDELRREIREKLEISSGGNLIIWVNFGNSYQEVTPESFTLDFEKEEHFYSLVENLKAKNQLPHQIIFNGLNYKYLDKSGQVAVQLNNSYYTLFYLSKALLKEKYQNTVRILSFFQSDDNTIYPLNSALAGFLKTLTLESPKFQGKVVELQKASEKLKISISEKAEIIIEEFNEDNWIRNEIRYEFLKEKQLPNRKVKVLVPFANNKNKFSDLPLKQGGVYIISGGIGGLGFIFSEYLAKNYHCKLVLFGRSTLNKKQEAKLAKLKSYNSEVLYLQADVSNLKNVEMVVTETKRRFSAINGVIHSAGVNIDSFILKKTKVEIEKVFGPKVYGTINLDDATKGEKLDLFIMFSSVAGVLGNIGQCDYAYGNHFLDSFAENRNKLAKLEQRYGHTLSINWPYWEEGGMELSIDEAELAKKQTGIYSLPTKDGILFWEEFLQSGLSQGVALYGLSTKIRANIEQGPVVINLNKQQQATNIDTDILLEKTEFYLKNLIGKEIKLSFDRIDSQERFESYGIDSIIISKINVILEKDLGAMPKTLFYEYSTIEELANYLIQQAKHSLIQFFNLDGTSQQYDVQISQEDQAKTNETAEVNKQYDSSEPIAIIGVHGHFPQSENLDSYWENLKQGKDLIDLVPSNRWNYEEFYHQDPNKASEGKIYCKWGGFINDVDKFDSEFFKIPEEEARIMDPQERLFLESVWASIEDAGYTIESLKKRYPKGKSADVGVYVGVTTNTYNLLAADSWKTGNSVPGGHPWSIANRVSYYFDFQGSSVPVDTACSSSLVAIHLACESLKKKECQIAVAGGVNLYLHPSKYHSLCKNRMVSTGGKCHSFGAGDDGFVPGEGVGALLLKPLNKAIEDKDNIYAVIAGSAFAHSGRSNGYSSPNPNSQANLISETLAKANINPESISYIEGHGTGTQLGDSLEIVALTKAFQQQTGKKQFCPIGSVKANIGHAEAAAGIAGVAKVLLQLKHRQLVPTIHSEEVNPNIEFEESPFYLQHKLSHWQSSKYHRRRALINSFGAGGVNASIIIEEFEKTNIKEEPKDAGPYLVVLSARNEEGLKEYVNRMLTYIGKNKNINLANLSYTLQVGREAMHERLAIIAANREELMNQLKDWRQQKPLTKIYQGKIYPQKSGNRSLKKRSENQLETIYETLDLDALAKRWIEGNEVNWEKLNLHRKPIRITLPTYPFAKQRHWVDDAVSAEKKTSSVQNNGHLHPLISYNSSTLKEVCFTSLLSDEEFYSLDHQVNNEKIFPGSGFLEIAVISGNIAGEQKISKIKDIVWVHPLRFQQGAQLVQTSLIPKGNATAYQITSFNDDNEKIVHAEGKLLFENGTNKNTVDDEKISVKELIKKCAKPQGADFFYNLFKKANLNYGPAFRTVQEFYVNNSFALSKLKIADYLKADFEQFVLHPSLLDGALQTVAGLIGKVEPSTAYLPFAIDEIQIIRQLPQVCYAYAEFSISDTETEKDIKKFNVLLLNEDGDVFLRIKNFYARALGRKLD